MILLENRIEAFDKLGQLLLALGKGQKCLKTENSKVIESFDTFDKLIAEMHHYNAWFDELNVRRMMFSLGESLNKKKLLKWVGAYEPIISEMKNPKTVAVIMAGNIPAVGFHDFLSVLITGNNLLAKLSSDDNKLMPAIADLLISIEPDFETHIQFTSEHLKSFDAIIATGSNNTSRYFDYYFSAYPHIIRKNRNGIAVLTGNESGDDFEGLTADIMDYYGLGCRNVSKVYVPINFDFISFLDIVTKRKDVVENHKYFNNYEYNKAIFLVNGKKHCDSGNLLLTEEIAIASPISVLNFEHYSDLNDLKKVIEIDAEKIQSVITDAVQIEDRVPFGKSQQPELWDYADGVDTMDFLLNLS